MTFLYRGCVLVFPWKHTFGWVGIGEELIEELKPVISIIDPNIARVLAYLLSYIPSLLRGGNGPKVM